MEGCGSGDAPSQVSATLESALRCATQLTSLAIIGTVCSTPCAVAGLSRLQHCCLAAPCAAAGAAADDEETHPPDESASCLDGLPKGPWAASLRALGAEFPSLLRSQALLQAAGGQLETLCCVGAMPLASRAQQEAFWRWAAAAPRLRRIKFDLSSIEHIGGMVRSAVLALQQARPDLQIQGLEEDPLRRRSSDTFYQELFTYPPDAEEEDEA